MTDLKKLRELAEKATFPSSEWDSEHPASDEWKANKENNLAWCRAANPQAIIEVLDRLERYEKALRFYADPNNWADVSYEDCERLEDCDGTYLGPAGHTARKALEGGK